MSAVWLGLILAAAIELVTIFFRFGLKLQSTRDTSFLRHVTFGWRIHHGYIGLLLLAAAPFLASGTPLQFWAIALGLALFISDIVHHFLVLWPITGSPEWDLRYPDD